VGDPLDFAVITALVLASTQALGPRIRAWLRPHARNVQSFGGGVALAYIFLSLFPEIDNAHPWLGDRVHLTTLVGFLLFFALEAWLIGRARARDASTEDGESAVMWLHIGVMGLYTAIVMFTLPAEIADDLLFAIVTGLAIGVHLVYKDYVLRDQVGDQFRVTGRLLLTVAPLVGWVAHRIADPSEAVLDVAMAVLAGVLMQSVFRDELPRPDRASLPWLLGGVATFALLAMLA
jgi:zinc transporter ZupT